MPPRHCYHPPGQRTRGGVLDVGLKCPHACRFCYHSYHAGQDSQFAAQRSAAFRETSNCLRQLEHMAAHGITHLDITGGEPTLHPGLVEIVRHASHTLGMAVRLITLGQFLLQAGKQEAFLLDRLIDAGLTSVLFSIHVVEEELCRQFTGGSWYTQQEALDRLDALDFQYAINTVVFAENFQMLPAIARMAARRGVYAQNFICFNPRHHWQEGDNAAGLVPDILQMRPYMEDAIHILDEAGIAVNVRFAPLCVLPGLEKHVVGGMGVQFDPHEWLNRAGNYDADPTYCAAPVPLSAENEPAGMELTRQEAAIEGLGPVIAWRGRMETVFPPRCARCSALHICDGLAPVLLREQGDGMLKPFSGDVAKGPLLRSRLAYPLPYYSKRHPREDMRTLMRRAYGRIPQDEAMPREHAQAKAEENARAKAQDARAKAQDARAKAQDARAKAQDARAKAQDARAKAQDA